MKIVLTLASLTLASLLMGSRGQEDDEPNDNVVHLSYISQADFCYNQPCENPEWKRQSCCEGYICIQPEVYEPIQTARCVSHEAVPAVGREWYS